MKQDIDPRLEQFQHLKKLRKLKATAEQHVPGARDVFLSTRGYSASGKTIALNVLNWREQRQLEDNSVQQSIEAVLQEGKRDFPGVASLSDALQMRRWKRQKEHQATLDL